MRHQDSPIALFLGILLCIAFVITYWPVFAAAGIAYGVFLTARAAGIEIVVAGWQSADGLRPGDDFPTVDDIHRIFLRPPARPRRLFPRPLDQVIY